jgi:hypothetical protein
MAAEIKIIAKIISGLLNNDFKPIKTGNAPKIKARQVKPKAKAVLPGNIFEIATKVTGMVILNKNIPVMARYGLFEPNARKGIDKNKAPTATLTQPNLSAKIPPSPLPNTTAIVKVMSKLMSDFHGKTMARPISDLIAIDENTKSKITSK